MSLWVCGGVLGWVSFRTGRGKVAGVLGTLMAVGLVALIAMICSAFPSTDVDPESAFRFVAGLRGTDTIPAGVTDLQADGASWMDVSVCCRFSATDGVIDAIIARGYESAKWEDVKAEMVPGSYTKEFSPKWAPEDVAMKECYIKRVERKETIDELYLVVDRERGIVYAVGSSNVWSQESD
mgnify:CR=1 FL=1